MHGLQLHTVSINKMIDNFGRLNSTLGRLTSDVTTLKQLTQQGGQDISALQEDRECIMQRLDRQSGTNNRLNGIRYQPLRHKTKFEVRDTAGRYNTTSTDLIVDMLNDYSTRALGRSDINRAFRGIR